MQKVDFYILEGNKQRAMLFVCELVEKYYQEKKSVYIHTDSQNSAEFIDNLLWTYKDDSFLPHSISSAEHVGAPPNQVIKRMDPGWEEHPTRLHAAISIQIGYNDIASYHQDLLINLHTEIPPQFHQFNHIIEIVFSDPLVQQLARNRYKQYREKGIELITHKQK